MTDLDSLFAQGRSLLDAASAPGWSVDGHSHATPGCRCFTCHDEPTVWQTSNMVDCDETAAQGAESCETSGFTLADAELIVWARNHLQELLDALSVTHAVAEMASGVAAFVALSVHTHKVRGDGASVAGCLRCWAPTLAAVTKPWTDHLARQEDSDV